MPDGVGSGVGTPGGARVVVGLGCGIVLRVVKAAGVGDLVVVCVVRDGVGDVMPGVVVPSAAAPPPIALQ